MKQIDLFKLNTITGKYKCPKCDKEYSKFGIKNHYNQAHEKGKNPMSGKKAWNKGLTKNTDERIKKSAKTLSDKYTNGELVHPSKGKTFICIEEKTDLELYRYYSKFQFSLNKYPEKYDFSLIEKYGWYKAKHCGDNMNGVSRDHMISVRYGFDNNIPTWIISHPANCQLKRHNDNVSKGMKCDLTLDELLEKIKKW